MTGVTRGCLCFDASQVRLANQISELIPPPLATRQSRSITVDQQVASPGMYPSKFPDTMHPSFPPYLINLSIFKSRCEVVGGMLCKGLLTRCENGHTRNVLEHVENQAPKDGRYCIEAHLTIEDINQIQIEKVVEQKRQIPT
jgi:hypothetical protein